MIYSFTEQLLMIFHFLILGMFLSIMFDTINSIFNKIKIINYILQFISWMIINIICIRSIDRISQGYIPIYIFLFFVIGYLIYHYFFSKRYLKTLLIFMKNKKNILLAIFPITLYNYIKKKIHKLHKKKGNNNEKNNIGNTVNINDGSDTRVYR